MQSDRGQSVTALALASAALPRCPALTLHFVAEEDREAQAIAASVAMLAPSVRARVNVRCETCDAEGPYFDGLRVQVLAEAGGIAAIPCASLCN